MLKLDYAYILITSMFVLMFSFQNIEHLTLAVTVDWYDPQKAAVSRAQVDPILPPVTAISCDDEILIIL